MKVVVVTLFPELFAPFAASGFIKRAIDMGTLELSFEHLREHGLGKHRSVDDTPYGGGSGMVIRVDCAVSALEAAARRLNEPCKRILLTPRGKRFTQGMAVELAQESSLCLVCGRYEGFDERVQEFVDREVSLGDFVLNGGEIPAMALLEATVRLLPGVLGNAESTREESFSSSWGMLEYPQYTRPASFRGLAVPEVLASGDHKRIAAWRRERARERTLEQRPDLIADAKEKEDP